MMPSRLFHNVKNLQRVGIGGSGMSGIAEVLHSQGFVVTGSDMRESAATTRLRVLGVTVFIGHEPEHVMGAQVVVHSSAVISDNVELKEARRVGIPVIGRPEMLGELTRLKFTVGIAGTHGKTTTTSMIGQILTAADDEPTIIVGGIAKSLGAGGILGSGQTLVVEADEYDRTFLKMFPTIAVVTSLEADHLDCYSGLEEVRDAFIEYVNRVPFYGSVVLCWDDPEVRGILPEVARRHITYGTNSEADIWADEIDLYGKGSSFLVRHGNEKLGKVTVATPGLHNLQNALAAVAVSIDLDVPFAKIQEGLAAFSGVDRRFQVTGEVAEVVVIDDFAHHPTALTATLATARRLAAPKGKVRALFQPHLFSRTAHFQKEFGRSLVASDKVVVCDIYAAREEPMPGITGELIVKWARKEGHNDAHFIPSLSEAAMSVVDGSEAGDVILTLGAGDVWKTGHEMLEALAQKRGKV